MMQRFEDQVLFPGRGPIAYAPADLPFLPLSVTDPVMTPRLATWPRWLAPVLFGLGVCYIACLLLLVTTFLRAP